MASELTPESVVQATPDHVSADLQGEAAILDLSSGKYFGLDGVGAFVWDLLQEPKPVSELVDSVLAEYDVDPERCRQDLLNLLQELTQHGLAEVRDPANA